MSKLRPAFRRKLFLHLVLSQLALTSVVSRLHGEWNRDALRVEVVIAAEEIIGAICTDVVLLRLDVVLGLHS